MNDLDNSLPELTKLLDQRLGLMRTLAESLESSQGALGRKDAEAIARGAAHQAELCRQWSLLEEQLRVENARRRALPASAGSTNALPVEYSAKIAAEWNALGIRIRYLSRVHRSLLRHLQRSLAVVARIVASSAPTYLPAPSLLDQDARRVVGG